MIATGNPVVDAIDQVSGSNGRLRLAMLVGAHMESSWNATAVGDNGHSFGPFQINFPSHPGITTGQAESPSWAAAFMAPQYAAAVSRVPAGMWTTDAKNAAALAAYYAERPAQMYAANRIDSAWAAVQALGSAGGAGGTSGISEVADGAAGGAAAGVGAGNSADSGVQNFNPVGWLAGNIAKDIGPLVMTALFVITGLGLVVLGVWRSANKGVAR